MRRVFSIDYLIFMVLISSCSNPEQKVEIESEPLDEELPNAETIAVNFINNYAAYCEHHTGEFSVVDWANNEEYVSSIFVDSLEKMITDAYEIEPEMGLGYDPIFNAQDYPSEGFEFKTLTMEQTYLVTVCGKEWKEFEVKIKLASTRASMLIIGAGVVNMKD